MLLTTTCDIYRNNPPTGGAVATNVSCQLVPDYAGGAPIAGTPLRPWTHYLVIDTSVDIRDSFPGIGLAWNYGAADTIHIPSGGSTAYVVVFVEVRGKGAAEEHKRVYLDRQLPAWPVL